MTAWVPRVGESVAREVDRFRRWTVVAVVTGLVGGATTLTLEILDVPHTLVSISLTVTLGGLAAFETAGVFCATRGKLAFGSALGLSRRQALSIPLGNVALFDGWAHGLGPAESAHLAHVRADEDG